MGANLAFPHPETGELLDSREEFKLALQSLEERLAAVYRIIRPIREEWAERFESPELPRPRYRTQTQEKVARCPRCGTRLEERDASNDPA